MAKNPKKNANANSDDGICLKSLKLGNTRGS